MQLHTENPLTRLSVAELRTRTSMKWRTYPEDVLPLWVAEMDVPTPEPVAAAIAAAVRPGDTRAPVGVPYGMAVGAIVLKPVGCARGRAARLGAVSDPVLARG